MLHKITFWLLVIGGLNWGLEAFHTGLTAWLPWSVAMVIYVIVGLSALYQAFMRKSSMMAKPM